MTENEKFEEAKRLYQTANAEQRYVLESLFPELKELRDEIIRKKLVDLLYKVYTNTNYITCVEHEEAIAWLEKHKPVEHLELKAGHWYVCYRAYCCRADSLTVREGERFMCEKDGVVKGFVIKDAEKYFKECNAPAPYEDEQDTTQFKYNGSDDVRRQSTIQVLEYARSLDTYNQYGKADIDKNIAWLEKQGKPMWSNEDSLMIDSIIDTMKWLEGKGATNMKLDWLKSLKQRMGI